MSTDRESAWQAWKAREARYRDSSMTDLRQAFEAGWEALVRPVEGVTLTPEEARRAVGWLDMSNFVPEDDDLALVNRLEASS